MAEDSIAADVAVVAAADAVDVAVVAAAVVKRVDADAVVGTDRMMWTVTVCQLWRRRRIVASTL